MIMNIRRLAIASVFVLAAPIAIAQTGQRSTTQGLSDKDQEQTTAIPKNEPANPGLRPAPSAGDRLQNRVQIENDQTTGTQKQGPAVGGGAPNPSPADLQQQQIGVQKDQERTTGVPSSR
jgi:hypothetical protein